MFNESVQLFHISYLPHTNLAIETADCNKATVGTKGDRGNASECLYEHRACDTGAGKVHVLCLNPL